MYLHNKIIKFSNIEYYLCKNTASSKNYFVMGYLKEGKEQIDSDVLAWINGKTKSIEWNDDTMAFNKEIIKNIAINLI